MATARFKKLQGLRTRREFVRVQSTGRRFKGRHVVVLATPNAEPEPRVGFTVSRKVGGAVVRNKVRRRLREILRTHPEWLATPTDVVVIALPSAAAASFSTLREELGWLLEKACGGRPRRD